MKSSEVSSFFLALRAVSYMESQYFVKISSLIFGILEPLKYNLAILPSTRYFCLTGQHLSSLARVKRQNPHKNSPE